MTAEIVRDVLAWSTVMNLSVLVLWFLFFVFAHDWMYGIHGKWFNLTIERFDAIHYTSMAFYKLCIFLFNLVPYLALRIVV